MLIFIPFNSYEIEVIKFLFYKSLVEYIIYRLIAFYHRKVFKATAFFNSMLKIKKITEVIGKKVYTDTGDFFGEIEESNLIENKVEGWRIRVASSMGNFLGGARGVIIPHQFVKAISDVFIINKAAELGIADKVLFAGFLQGADVDRAYQIADLYVMPSVSEPFGITPLEALRNNVPVIISKQSGVSEVLENALKVDFWDIDEMANKIVNVLHYGELRDELRDRGSSEVKKFNWDEPAGKCVDVYKKILGGI